MAVRKRVAALSDDVSRALVRKLSRGRHRNGINLTRDECQSLWEVLVGERELPRRRGPKPDPDLPLRDQAIAILVSLYEATGDPTKTAVAKVCERYGISRSQVFAARRLHPMPRATGDTDDPNDPWVWGVIGMYEGLWSK
jgi:hypothetical protein